MVSKTQVKSLLEHNDYPSISIHIPTYRAGQNQEDRLRLKNAIKEAEAKLKAKEMEDKEIRKLLAPAHKLLEDEQFWLGLSDGLSLFIAPDFYEQFIIPVNINPSVTVSNKFYTRPLLPAITGNQRFFLLALSQNEVRFFEGNKYSISPVIIDDLVPQDLKTAVALDKETEYLQSHSGGIASGTVIYHGKGLGKDHKLKHIRQYFQQVDKGLMNMLHDENAPLVIAAVDYLVPIYREISKYTNIVDIHIGGNPENDDPVLLHEKAWEIINTFNKKDLNKWQTAFPELMAKRRASTELSTILRAATQGKIDQLFIDKDKKVWGNFDLTQNILNTENVSTDNNEDLLALAAALTFQNQGIVYNVTKNEMPDAAHTANAIFRY